MRTRAIYSLLILFALLARHNVQSQGSLNLLRAEKELKEDFKAINLGQTDSARLVISLVFREELRLALNIRGSDTYGWDSLKYIAKVESPDGLFRLYNWNIPLTGGGNRYFCLIQFKGALKKIPPVALSDRSSSITEPGQFRGDSLRWFGALYYKVIPFELKDAKTSYILLGWLGISNEVSGKIMEVLTLDSKGTPAFGETVFPDYGDGHSTRIIFRFSSSSAMSLRYLLQPLPGKPLWNSRKKIYESDNHPRWMLVFDHLVPMDPQLEGQFKFYVPASETAEGFVYENYKWKYIKEFDARNP